MQAPRLMKSPGFVLTAALALALGLAACAITFALAYAVLFKPLPFVEPERLVWIENAGGDGGLSSRTSQSFNVRDWQQHSQTLSDVAAYYGFFEFLQFTLAGAGEPVRVQGLPVSGNFLDVLGVQPQLGRNFSAAELLMDWNAQAYPAALLTDRFWQQHFAADPGVLGRALRINGREVEVVGVLPASFDVNDIFLPQAGVDLLFPFPLSEQTHREGNSAFAVGRLAAGASVDQARAELNAISAASAAAHPERGIFGAQLTALETHLRGPYRDAFLILLSAVLALLLIVCLNLSNLMLVRTQGRSRELATRLALGATSAALAWQIMRESLLLAMLGGITGLALAKLGLQAADQLATYRIPLLASASFDSVVLAALAGATLLAGLLCGLLPALMVRKGQLVETINQAGTRGSAGVHMSRARRTLVMLQVMLACCLLITCSLLVESFRQVLKVDVGFEPRQLLAVRVDTARSFEGLPQALAYYDALLAAVQGLSGITSTGLSDTLPLGRNRSWGVGAEGVSYPSAAVPIASPRMVDPGYLPALGVALRDGRHFSATDDADSASVVMVSESLARRLWPNGNAVGQFLVRPWSNGEPYGRIIGVVADIPRELEGEVAADFYLSIRQFPFWASLEMVLRAERPLPSLIAEVRAALSAVDPGLATGDIIAFDDLLAQSMAPRSVTTALIGGYSLASLLVAALGIYSVIAFATQQRQRELAIRRALGSGRRLLAVLVLRESVQIATVGVLAGVALAWMLASVLQGMLFGVDARNPGLYVLAALFVMAVVLLASLAPAIRAAHADAVEALR